MTTCTKYPDFNKEILDSIFENIEREPDTELICYRVINEYGSKSGMITFLDGYNIRIYVDNFPSQKKYFECNYPIRSTDEFIKDIERTGLNLIQRNPKADQDNEQRN